MVILGGWAFLMSEVPLYTHLEDDVLVFDARREAVPFGRRVVLQEVPVHTVEHDPFIKSQLASMELTRGANLVT